MLGEGRKVGHSYSQPNLIGAAVAAQLWLTAVKRDTTHYEKAGVAVMNPWVR